MAAIIHGGPLPYRQGTKQHHRTTWPFDSDYVVTEAGFGFELGRERYFDIRAPYGKLIPASLFCANVRALNIMPALPGDLNEANPRGGPGMPN